MEIEIIDRRENPLLSRVEVRFRVNHPDEKTPQRDTVRDALASILDATKDRIVIDNMKPQFGMPVCIGYAKIYESKDKAIAIERKSRLKRNKIR